MAKIHPDKTFKVFSNISEDEITSVFSIHGAFSTNASFFSFLAGLGHLKGKRIKTKERDNWGEVQGRIFENNGMSGQIYAIALASTKDYSILKDEDTSYAIFEEYVNGGFDCLLDISKKYNDEESFVDAVLELVREQAISNAEFEDVIDSDGGLDLTE